MTLAAVNQRRRRVRIALAVAAVCVGGIVLGVVRASRLGRPLAFQSTGAVGPFRIGEEARSRAHVRVRLDLGRGAPPQEMELEGDWRTGVTDLAGGLAISACQLDGLKVIAREGVGASARASDTGTELTGELGRKFFVSQRADGAVFEVWLPRGMKPAMANILLTLVGEAQLVRPAQPQTAWIIEERDVNGAYLAAYQKMAPGHFHKQKARYLDTTTPASAGGGATPPHIRIDRSDVELVASDTGRLIELRADDVTTIELAGLSFNVDLHVALEQAQLSSSPTLAGSFAREREQFEPHPMAQLGLDPAAEAAQQDRALLAGATVDNLLVELRALPPDAAGSRSAMTLEARWEALLRLDPAVAARVPALVRTAPEQAGKVLVDATSASATSETQAALAAVATDRAVRPKLRQYAIQYLGLQHAPTSAAVAGLRALLDDPDHDRAQAALLALGACARGLRPTAPDRTRELVGELQGRLARASEKRAREDLIVALGNAGDPTSLPVLREAIAQKDDDLRTMAIEALRFIDDPAVDPLLGGLLGRTADPSARFATLSAIRFRNIGPFASQLADVARHDPSENFRRAAIDLLGAHLADLPTLRPLLKEIAHGDADRNNRELAERYLGNG